MRNTIAVFILLLSMPLHAEDYISESYEISIGRCPEGYVSCDTIEFELTDKKTEIRTLHIGETMHSLCKDGLTPCQFRGYQFKVGDLNFIIYADGTLEVNEKSGQAIIVEEGKWVY